MTIEPLKVSLGAEGGTKIFKSIEELSGWMQNELQFWSWGNASGTSEGHQVSGTFNNFFNSVTSQISEFNRFVAQKAQPNHFTNIFTSIINSFESFYGTQHGLYSESPKARFLEQLKTENNNPRIAIFAWGYFNRTQINFSNPDGLRGVFAAQCFEAGLKNAAKNEMLTLQKLHNDWQSVFQGFETNLSLESGKHNKLNADLAISLSAQNTNLSELVSATQENLDNFVNASNEKLKQLISTAGEDWRKLKATYDGELAIRAPVLYWKSKTSSHLLLSWIFAVLSILVGGVIFFLIFLEVQALIIPPKGLEHPDLWHPEYWRLAMLITSGLFGIWIVRIIVRLFLSNVHLHTDAKERVTMVQTYLALVRRGKISKEDEHFILRTLFRPSTTGIMKDDGIPLTALEAASKIEKG